MGWALPGRKQLSNPVHVAWLMWRVHATAITKKALAAKAAITARRAPRAVKKKLFFSVTPGISPGVFFIIAVILHKSRHPELDSGSSTWVVAVMKQQTADAWKIPNQVWNDFF